MAAKLTKAKKTVKASKKPKMRLMVRPNPKPKPKAKAPVDDSVLSVKVYERVVLAYDLVIAGKVFRWDSSVEARNFAKVNKRRMRLIRIPSKYKASAFAVVSSTTPDALVRKSVIRKKVRNLPHEVKKD